MNPLNQSDQSSSEKLAITWALIKILAWPLQHVNAQIYFIRGNNAIIISNTSISISIGNSISISIGISDSISISLSIRGSPIGFSGSGIWLISRPEFGILKEKGDLIRDCN